MIRELQVNGAKNVPAQHTAAVQMVTGMGAQISVASATLDKAVLPAAATADNIYMVERERIAEGLKAGVVNLDDYDEDYVTVKADTKCELIPMYAGERYGTDQYNAANVKAANVGKYLAVGTDGKWDIAAGTVASRYQLAGMLADGAHTLAVIRVLDTAGKNA